MLKKQNRIYKKYKNSGFKDANKVPLDLYRKECAEAIEKSKQNYLLKLGSKLADKFTGQKSDWKIVNKLMNKCKIPRIPPLLIAGNLSQVVKKKPPFLTISLFLNANLSKMEEYYPIFIFVLLLKLTRLKLLLKKF